MPFGHATEAGGNGAWRQRRLDASLDETYRAGGMAALEPKRRDTMTQSGTDHEPPDDSPDALRRRIRELKSGGRVDEGSGRGRKKDPGCRPAAPVES